MTKFYTLLLLIMAILGSFNNVSAQTSVAGGNVSGTWTLAGSPYLINGSIQIPNGQTLTIEPGVTVNFQGHYKLYVQGRILAIGTVSDTITFTASDTTTGWKGIRFDNTPATNDSSIFFYCKIQYGRSNKNGTDYNGGAFYFNYFSKTIISFCLISNNFAEVGGGGIYCYYSSPSIYKNTIFKNTTNFSGGGIICIYSNPLISDNTISSNKTSLENYQHGGGIYCDDDSRPIIINNIISHNIAYYGGGISSSNCSPIISGNTIINNSATSTYEDAGGGIHCGHSGIPVIINNNISNNLSASKGGGIACKDCNPNIINNIISNNLSLLDGGGISCYYSNTNIIKNIITNNSALSAGGGIYSYNYSPTITNNIITNNSASKGGGIYSFFHNPILINNSIINNLANFGGGINFYYNDNSILKNCIIWGNNADTSGAQIYLNTENADPDFFYCNIQGETSEFGYNGDVFYTGTYQNNLDSDPLFVSPTAGSGTSYDGAIADWSLQDSSLCINAGTTDTTGLNLPSTDIAGNPRVSNGRIDIGAYEHLGTSINNPITNNLINIYPNPNNGKFLLYLENYESKNYTLEIYDITGQIIYYRNYENKTFLVENIVLSEAESGIYLVKVTDGKKNLYKNVLIYK